MIDIHMHLIPGVDDGAADLAMSLGMLLRAKEQGITGIFATPHSSAFDGTPEFVRNQFRELQLQAGRIFPDIKIYPGCEVLCDSDDMTGVLLALRSGRYPTLNGTNYVLTEFSMWVSPEAPLPRVEALVKAGYIPVIAHMERYKYLRGNMELVDKLRESGALLQINAYSLQEEPDETIKSWARQLALAKKVDFLGTDAHRTYHRPPNAASGLNWLYESQDKADADVLAFGNAQALLCGHTDGKERMQNG